MTKVLSTIATRKSKEKHPTQPLHFTVRSTQCSESLFFMVWMPMQTVLLPCTPLAAAADSLGSVATLGLINAAPLSLPLVTYALHWLLCFCT